MISTIVRFFSKLIHTNRVREIIRKDRNETEIDQNKSMSKACEKRANRFVQESFHVNRSAFRLNRLAFR